ncbi:MAG TPA: hypothetical protein VNM22_03520 [Candidatus Limnocylindrales bacterium]|nr:hypothetical protein [Candidatus Limnocylindrales bacterium]
MFKSWILLFLVGSLVFLNPFFTYPEVFSEDLITSLPKILDGLSESIRKVRCDTAIRREEVLYATVENPEEFKCLELYLEMFGGMKAEEYLGYILEIQGKRYGQEMTIGFKEGDLFLGRKTPKLFPQLYALRIRFSPSGKEVIQHLSDKYIELMAFRFDQVPKRIKQESLGESLLYEQFLQYEDVFSEDGKTTYTNSIVRISTEDTVMILSGIDLSEEVWKEILTGVMKSKR